MAKELFVKKNFQRRRRGVIERANQILETYYKTYKRPMTLRQLFYQLVSHHGYKNDSNNASQLSDIMSDARLAGLTDWAHLEDRGREHQHLAHWESLAAFTDPSGYEYREDLWATQKYRPEVWIEKDALVGVIEGFRWCLLGTGEIDGWSLPVSVATSALLLVTGFRYFRASERRFADTI